MIGELEATIKAGPHLTRIYLFTTNGRSFELSIYGLPLKQVNNPFIINSGLRQGINPCWQFAYLLGQLVLPVQQMALGGCNSTVRWRKVLAHFDEIGS